MAKIIHIPELPMTYLSVDGEGIPLQAVEGRSIITQKTPVRVGNVNKDGYVQRYTYTLAELTMLVEQFQSKKRVDRISLFQIRRLVTQHALFQKYLIDTKGEMYRNIKEFYNQHKTELSKTTQLLNDMLEGKIPSKGKEYSAIKVILDDQTKQLNELEEKMKDILVQSQ